MELLVKFLPLFGVFALLFVVVKNIWVSKQDVGDEKMARIAKNIADGAMSFLKAEYKILSVFVVAVAILLYFKGQSEEGSNGMVAVSFIVGAICSALAGFIGMKVATKANVRTTNAARQSLGKALEVAFAGGAVMGLGVVGLGVLGLSGLFMITYDSVRPSQLSVAVTFSAHGMLSHGTVVFAGTPMSVGGVLSIQVTVMFASAVLPHRSRGDPRPQLGARVVAVVAVVRQRRPGQHHAGAAAAIRRGQHRRLRVLVALDNAVVHVGEVVKRRRIDVEHLHLLRQRRRVAAVVDNRPHVRHRVVLALAVHLRRRRVHVKVRVRRRRRRLDHRVRAVVARRRHVERVQIPALVRLVRRERVELRVRRVRHRHGDVVERLVAALVHRAPVVVVQVRAHAVLARRLHRHRRRAAVVHRRRVRHKRNRLVALERARAVHALRLLRAVAQHKRRRRHVRHVDDARRRHAVAARIHRAERLNHVVRLVARRRVDASRRHVHVQRRRQAVVRRRHVVRKVHRRAVLLVVGRHVVQRRRLVRHHVDVLRPRHRVSAAVRARPRPRDVARRAAVRAHARIVLDALNRLVARAHVRAQERAHRRNRVGAVVRRVRRRRCQHRIVVVRHRHRRRVRRRVAALVRRRPRHQLREVVRARPPRLHHRAAHARRRVALARRRRRRRHRERARLALVGRRREHRRAVVRRRDRVVHPRRVVALVKHEPVVRVRVPAVHVPGVVLWCGKYRSVRLQLSVHVGRTVFCGMN